MDLLMNPLKQKKKIYQDGKFIFENTNSRENKTLLENNKTNINQGRVLGNNIKLFEQNISTNNNANLDELLNIMIGACSSIINYKKHMTLPIKDESIIKLKHLINNVKSTYNGQNGHNGHNGHTTSNKMNHFKIIKIKSKHRTK